MKNWIEALKSGWRAGLKQYRKRRTELAKKSDAMSSMSFWDKHPKGDGP